MCKSHDTLSCLFEMVPHSQPIVGEHVCYKHSKSRPPEGHWRHASSEPTDASSNPPYCILLLTAQNMKQLYITEHYKGVPYFYHVRTRLYDPHSDPVKQPSGGSPSPCQP